MNQGERPLEMPQTLQPLLESLNSVQREAVRATEGPLLLFAGAGSGKTRVLTYRAAYLIEACQVPPYQILAVTFTNKAASEMRERLEKLTGESTARRVRLGTFHSICARLLREFALEHGLDRNFVVYDDTDQILLVRECLKRLELDESKFTPRSILSHISRAKEKMILPNMWHEYFHGFFEDMCGKVYPLYQQMLRNSNALDFDDLLSETVLLLQKNEQVRETLQQRFRYILVDEYQDVNMAQYQIVSLLAQKHRNLFVVGDDDQSVYGWRGADVGIILRFETDYPEALVLKLEQNYRSTQTILDAAHAVVSQNRGRKEKHLWTENGVGIPLQLYEAENEKTEAEWVARTVLERVRGGGYSWHDFAILYRTNAQSRVLEDMLRAWNIPHRIAGGTRFYDRKEIKDAIAYLRVIQNPRDSVSMKRILNVPARGIGATSLKALDEEMVVSEASLWDILLQCGEMHSIASRTRKKLQMFAELLQALQQEREKLPVSVLLLLILEKSGYLAALQAENTLEAQGRLENLKELLIAAEEYWNEDENPSVTGFLERVSLVSDIDSLEAGANAVTLMTLHSAKGLEFGVVFLVGMEEQVFPHARSLTSDKELEEERRLCYVGITRAQREVLLSHALRRSSFYGVSFNPPSRFLEDIPLHLFHNRPAPRASRSRSDDALFASSSPPKRLWEEAPVSPAERHRREGGSDLRIGQKVRHSQFGVGVVVKVSGEGDSAAAEIAFPNVGIKKLLLSIARLEPVK